MGNVQTEIVPLAFNAVAIVAIIVQTILFFVLFYAYYNEVKYLDETESVYVPNWPI